MARNVVTKCSTETSCRYLAILDRVSQGTEGRSYKAERMLDPVPVQDYSKRKIEMQKAFYFNKCLNMFCRIFSDLNLKPSPC